MELLNQLEQYRPFNEQEARDREELLRRVRSGEDLDGFVASVRRDPHVRRVVILSAGNEWDEDAVRLAEKYGNVSFYNTTER